MLVENGELWYAYNIHSWPKERKKDRKVKEIRIDQKGKTIQFAKETATKEKTKGEFLWRRDYWRICHFLLQVIGWDDGK